MPTSDDVLNRFFQLTVLMSDAMEHDLATRGLTRARATLISYLRDGGPAIQRELAKALRVSPRNITGLVTALEADGLVTRSVHPTDRRALLIELTAAGSRAARALARDHHDLAGFLFSGRTAADLTELDATFGQLVERLSEPGFENLRRRALQRWPLTNDVE